jgi:death on curing protein
MISKERAEFVHFKLIEKHGGSQGIRDSNLLHSAINRPYATFDGIDLYPSPIEKAAAILESTLINHPFVDGNKRTGYTLSRLILLTSGYDIVATQNEKYDFVIQVTTGKLAIEEITVWLQKNTTKL